MVRTTCNHAGISPFPELDFSGLTHEVSEEMEGAGTPGASWGCSCMWPDRP